MLPNAEAGTDWQLFYLCPSRGWPTLTYNRHLNTWPGWYIVTNRAYSYQPAHRQPGCVITIIMLSGADTTGRHFTPRSLWVRGWFIMLSFFPHSTSSSRVHHHLLGKSGKGRRNSANKNIRGSGGSAKVSAITSLLLLSPSPIAFVAGVYSVWWWWL